MKDGRVVCSSLQQGLKRKIQGMCDGHSWRRENARTRKETLRGGKQGEEGSKNELEQGRGEKRKKREKKDEKKGVKKPRQKGDSWWADSKLQNP